MIASIKTKPDADTRRALLLFFARCLEAIEAMEVNLKRYVRCIPVGVKAEINISAEEEWQAEVEQRRD